MPWAYASSAKIKAFVIVIFLSVTSLLFLGSGWIQNSYSFSSPVIQNRKSQNPDDPIANATLGFQEVTAISLKSRPDRRTAIVDAARATNISLKLLNGLIDDEIPAEYIPKGWELEEHDVGQLGAYVSHLRALERIVNESISTALIMESDADWDLRIRDTLLGVARGVKRVMDFPFSGDDGDGAPSSQAGPYGDHWDVIWLGHCGSLRSSEGRVYQFNDPAAAPKTSEYAIIGAEDSDTRPDDIRLVYELRDAVCSWGYAVTLEGARKLRKAGEESSMPWDLRLNELCKDDASIRCATVYPQIISAAYSKPAIQYSSEMTPPPTNPFNQGPTPGPAIQISARRNSHLVAQGVPRAQWIKEW